MKSEDLFCESPPEVFKQHLYTLLHTQENNTSIELAQIVCVCRVAISSSHRCTRHLGPRLSFIMNRQAPSSMARAANPAMTPTPAIKPTSRSWFCFSVGRASIAAGAVGVAEGGRSDRRGGSEGGGGEDGGGAEGEGEGGESGGGEGGSSCGGVAGGALISVTVRVGVVTTRPHGLPGAAIRVARIMLAVTLPARSCTALIRACSHSYASTRLAGTLTTR